MNGSITVDGFNGLYYSPGKNYVIERTYMEASTSNPNAKFVENVNYLDGFGKKIQEILVQGSPGGNADIIVPHVYGTHGREEKNYLPYSRTGNTGTFDVNAMNTSNWNIYDPAEAAYAYNQTVYDNSPLDRVIKTVGAGKVWHSQNKGTETIYGTNTSGEVLLFRIAQDGALSHNNSTYTAGSLRKEIVMDEDSCQVKVFTDRNDRTILVANYDGNNWLETYYVYDKRGLLRYLLPPEASYRLKNSITQETLQKYAYYYEYDASQRLILKCLPGSTPVYMTYDKRNRLVMSQEGKQRTENNNKWSYTLYDAQNRIVEIGEVILSSAITFSSLQSLTSTSDNYVPAGNRTDLQHIAYDTYTSLSVEALPFKATPDYANTHYSMVSGLITSVKSRILGTDKWLTTTTYYDDQCRVIQTASNNIQGGISRVNMKYDFIGNIVQKQESHQISSTRTDVLETINSYDNRKRLVSSSVKLNNGSPATINYTYDAVGRLVSRALGNITETKTYNTRGWLTSQESSPFKMKLRYDTPQGNAKARYNGSISEWEWQHGTDTTFMYGFTYDKQNRLKETFQKRKNGSSWVDYTKHYLEKNISYDRNGNIMALLRSAGGQLVDNLVYSYDGNQLVNLTENNLLSPQTDIYIPEGKTVGHYTYDSNGNMITDSRRNLNLTYNVLNYLNEVKVANTTTTLYSYLSDGTKLSVRDGTGTNANGFDYMGSLSYKKSSAGLQLETAKFSDGVIRVTGSNNNQQEINYFLTDHLGSVRAIVAANGTIRERDDYYPFGARHVRKNYPRIDNRFLYNGKENQVTGNLGYLDYGERMYDNTLGIWLGQDLKANEYPSWGTYAYVQQNPINNTDPDGTSTWVMPNSRGGFTVMDGKLDGDLNIYVFTVRNMQRVVLYILGQSLTETSFYDPDGFNPFTNKQGIFRGTIDQLDLSGSCFLDEIMNNTPGLFDYMWNATTNRLYDFKKWGYVEGKDDINYLYRGMPLGKRGNKVIYGSARDVGNIAAGYMAGVHGIPWELARKAFDGLESHQNKKTSIEGISTQNAQALGWKMGKMEFAARGLPNIWMRMIKFMPGIGTFIKPYTRGNIREYRKLHIGHE